MPNGRVQAPDVLDTPTALRPAGAPPDTFAAAPQPVKDNRLGDLADALGSFNTGLTKFGHAYMVSEHANKATANKADMDAFNNFKAAHTESEYLDAVKNGQVPRFATPQAQAAADYTHGQYTAHQLGNEITEKLGNGELRYEDGSAQSYLAQRRDEIIKQNGWQDGVGPGRGFGETFIDLNNKANANGMKAQIGLKQEAYNTAAFQQVEMFADKAVQGKLDPTQSWVEFNKLKGSLGDAMHLQPKEVDDVLMKSLARRVDVDPNWVMGMATAKRMGVDGKELPALSENPAYVDQIKNWGEQAYKSNVKAGKAQVEDQAGQEALQRLVRADGSFNAIVGGDAKNPISGDDVHLTREKLQERAVEKYEQASAAIAQQNKETPTQTFNRDMEVYVKNGLARPAWKKELENAPMLANNTNLSDPKVVTRLVAAAQTYDKLNSASPAYVRDQFNEKSRTFFDTFRVLKDYSQNADGSKLTDVQALTMAGNGNRLDKPELHDYLKSQMATMDNNINKLVNPNSGVTNLWGMMPGSDALPAGNKSQIIAEVRRLSTAIITTGGLDADTAVKAAVKMIQNTTTVVNGQWMPKDEVSGLDMNGVSSRLVGQYIDTHGKQQGLTNSDVHLMNTGDGNFVMTDRNGIPVPGGGRFTRGDMLRVQGDINQERNNAILQQQHDHATAASPRDDVNVVPGARERAAADQRSNGPSFFQRVTSTLKPLQDWAKGADKSVTGMFKQMGQDINKSATDRKVTRYVDQTIKNTPELSKEFKDYEIAARDAKTEKEARAIAERMASRYQKVRQDWMTRNGKSLSELPDPNLR